MLLAGLRIRRNAKRRIRRDDGLHNATILRASLLHHLVNNLGQFRLSDDNVEVFQNQLCRLCIALLDQRIIALTLVLGIVQVEAHAAFYLYILGEEFASVVEGRQM